MAATIRSPTRHRIVVLIQGKAPCSIRAKKYGFKGLLEI